MSNDSQLINLVLGQLVWDARLDETDIGVAVEDGAITLIGHEKSYSEKLAAAKTGVGCVRGVKSKAVDIKGRFPGHKASG